MEERRGRGLVVVDVDLFFISFFGGRGRGGLCWFLFFLIGISLFWEVVGRGGRLGLGDDEV